MLPDVLTYFRFNNFANKRVWVFWATNLRRQWDLLRFLVFQGNNCFLPPFVKGVLSIITAHKPVDSLYHLLGYSQDVGGFLELGQRLRREIGHIPVLIRYFVL